MQVLLPYWDTCQVSMLEMHEKFTNWWGGALDFLMEDSRQGGIISFSKGEYWHPAVKFWQPCIQSASAWKVFEWRVCSQKFEIGYEISQNYMHSTISFTSMHDDYTSFTNKSRFQFVCNLTIIQINLVFVQNVWEILFQVCECENVLNCMCLVQNV